MGGHDGRRPAHRPGRVHAQHGLAHRPQRRGEVELGHHDALEHVGGLADDHGVDVAPVEPGVLEGTRRRFAHQPGDRDVLALGGVLGLPHTDHRAALGHHAPFPAGPEGSAARAHTRFCCRHGPEVAWAIALWALPSMMRAAASPIRNEAGHHQRVGRQRPTRGVDGHRVGQAQRVAQDELLVGERRRGARPRRRGPCPGRRPTASNTPAPCAAVRVDGDWVRSRAPRAWASMRWSMPVIQAGRSHSSRARSSAASTMATTPSVMGGRVWRRSGATT